MNTDRTYFYSVKQASILAFFWLAEHSPNFGIIDCTFSIAKSTSTHNGVVTTAKNAQVSSSVIARAIFIYQEICE